MRKLLVTLTVALLSVINATAQNQTVNGRVTDEGKVPLQGVSVSSTDGKYGTSTNKDGNFTLSLPSSVNTLQFTPVNFETMLVSVSGNSSIATMASSDKKLQELVVVGYSTQTQRTRIQAASIIRADEFANLPIISLSQALQGRADGVI